MINWDHEIPVEANRSDLTFETDNDSFKNLNNTRIESEENPSDFYRIAAN